MTITEREIFAEAMQISSAEDRSAFLDRACGGDAEVRNRVGSLLEEQDKLGSFLEAPAAAVATVERPVRERVGMQFGPYKLLQQIGEGGMGVVYLADQSEPVKRRVALKVIKPGMDSGQVIARFEAERQALAMMDHPNVNKVFDAGTTDSGRPYFVMELVKGIPITRYCDEHHLTLRERLELFVPVCQAIQHAHQKGIIHRDIKPTNVLVSLYDGQPVPKVIDFGVAKATAQKLTEKTMFTGFGQLVGTLEYMSPEQAQFNQLDIDTRSDVYSLGALLYELLTGSTPFEQAQLRTVAFDETLRIIREEEPPKPSARLSTSETLPLIAANRNIAPARLSKLVRGELEWIVMKCLEKDRSRRYETANELALDVQHYLRDEPIRGRPPSWFRRARNWARRHKSTVASLASFSIAGIVVFVIALVFYMGSITKLAEQRGNTNQSIAETLAAALELNPHEAPDKFTPISLRLSELVRRAETLAESDLADPILVQRVHDLRSRLNEQSRDYQIMQALDAATVSELEIDTQESIFQDESKIAGIADAFRACGLDPFTLDMRKLAGQIAGRPPQVRQRIVSALDEWNSLLRRQKKRSAEGIEKVRALTELLDAVDDDPWRKQLRHALASKETKMLAKLAASPQLFDQAPYTLKLLGGMLCEYPEYRDTGLDVLQRAQSRYPNDFWLNDELQRRLSAGSPHEDEERLRFASCAASLLPNNAGARLNLGNALNQCRRHSEAIEHFKKAIELKPDYCAAYSNLANALRAQKQLDAALAASRKAVELRPNDVFALNSLGNVLFDLGEMDAAMVALKRAIELEPGIAQIHNNLGNVLREKGEFEAAIVAYQRSLQLNSRHPGTHLNLANTWSRKGDFAAAVGEYHTAIDLQPDDAYSHFGLANALAKTGSRDAAIAAYRRAIQLKPGEPDFYLNVAESLLAVGKLDEAAAAARRAIELKPDLAEAYVNLGGALSGKGQVEAAIDAFRKAVELQPDLREAHNNLGHALAALRQYDAAARAYRKAIELDPGYALAHYNLAIVLVEQHDLDAAISEYRKTIQLAPDHAEAHCNLAFLLQEHGQYAEALQFLQIGHSLGSKQPAWPYPSAEWLKEARRLAEMEAKLPEVLDNSKIATNVNEWMQYAEICRNKHLYASTAKLLQQLLDSPVEMPAQTRVTARYDAACAAALAGTGQGHDASKISGEGRTSLRSQALALLGQQLTEYKTALNDDRKSESINQELTHWLGDADLAPVRETNHLANLSPEERKSWIELWQQVETLRGPRTKAPD